MSKEDSKNAIIKIYSDYDVRFGTWGWCSLDKAGTMIDFVDEIFTRVADPVCVEIGVYAGKSAIPVALELKRNKSGKLYAIDPWDNFEASKGYTKEHYQFWNTVNLKWARDIFYTALEETGCKEYVEIIEKPSDDAPQISNIDLLYIDGQHTDQAIRDAIKYATQVKIDGYCFVDDLDPSPESDWKEVNVVPEVLKSIGFEEIRWVDKALIFKRNSIR